MTNVLYKLLASQFGALWPYGDNLHLNTARKIRNRLLIVGIFVIACFAIGILLTVE